MKDDFSIGEKVLVLSNKRYVEAKIIHIHPASKDRIGWAECIVDGDKLGYRWSFLQIKKIK